MWEIDARTKTEKRKKTILIISLVIIVFLFSSIIALYCILQSEKNEELTYETLDTVEKVLKYYECTYISENKSNLEYNDVDIKLVFKCDLYDGDVSNEKFFNNVIEDVARVLNYANFRMIDEERKIEIKVVCENYKVSDIIINGISNYFIYMDSQKDLAKYVEFKNTDLQMNSPELINLMSINWETNFNLGTRESIFNNYYNYFDEGISTRTINNKIYNIVFTQEYNANVVNGIFPGMDNKAIEAKLGAPTFKDEELGIIGYKSKEIYVFFNEKEISVYRVSDVDISEFFKLSDKLLSEELDLLDFMNELTYMWPDYSEYNYNANSVFISYPLKGIDIKIGYEDTNAIVIYNNIKTNFNVIEQYLENPEFISRLGVDNLFEAEKRRVKANSLLLERCKEYNEKLSETERKKVGESLKYSFYPELDESNRIIKMCFVSKDGKNPNREIYESISSYLWCDSQIFIYSQSGKGIFAFNVTTGEKTTLVTGNQAFILGNFKNNILKYDNSEIEIIY